MPSLETLHDYNQELHTAYGREKEVAPRITDPTIAHNIGHELMQRLSDVDTQYNLNLASSETADDPIAAKQEDMMQREEGIKRAVSNMEFKHRKAAPIDFIDGERHFRSVKIDAAMQQRMTEHARKRNEKSLAQQIDAMGLDAIDPNNGGNGLIRKLDKPDQE